MKHKQSPEVFNQIWLITKFTPFLKGNLAEHQYLTILSCECKQV